MTAADSQGQVSVSGEAQRELAADEQVQAVKRTGQQAEMDSLDALLDDIETTLETNAEEYVQRFVQKGGQ